jgi:hypothetical protein
LSDDFSIVARDNGEVVEVDEKKGIAVIGYYPKKGPANAGKTPDKFERYQAIDIKPKVVKNGKI